MVKFVYGNIFASKCKCLVNAVNCVGVMGKGIALQFKQLFPNMYMDYYFRCKLKKINIGQPYVYNENNKQILNFPTKQHWHDKSQLRDIVQGLIYFVNNYVQMGITSIAFPALGCGCGGLEWKDVKPEMIKYLGNLPIMIEIYDPL